MDLITVAVAVYNAEKYIGRMLESILRQSYTNLEILVVDDGSKDDSFFICSQYNDLRIKLVKKENGGLSTARQFAIDNAKGSYICFVDADDELAPTYVEVMYDKIVQTESDICVCDYAEFSEQTNQVNRVVKLTIPDEFVQFSREHLSKEFYKSVEQLRLADSWNKMYSVDFIRKTGVGFQLDNQYNGTDLKFNHQLAIHCPKYCVVHETLYRYQITNNSRVRRKNKDLQTGFMIIIISLLIEARKFTQYLPQIENQIYYIYQDLIRRALIDCFRSSDTYGDFKAKYEQFRQKHFKYVDESFNTQPKKMYSLGSYIFRSLIKMRASLPMYLYIKIKETCLK
jgi:glycosyltransferase involved in cell wall biosynthesis